MPEADDKNDRQLWGMALKALRIRNGKTLLDAAAAYEPADFTPGDPNRGVSVQRWQAIEKGGAKFTDDQRRRLARAAGGDLEELELERARILGVRRSPRSAGVGGGVGEREPARGLVIPIWGRTEFDRDGWKIRAGDISQASFDLRELETPSIGAIYMPDDAMQPKVGPGKMVVFDRSRRPEPDRGCVVETVDGEMLPRIFLGDDAEHVIVMGLKDRKRQAIKRAQVRGVYAVRFWGD